MTDKEKNILSVTLATWGIIMIGSGIIMNSNIKEPIINKNYTLNVNTQQVSQNKTNELKLKEITIEVNNPISLNVKDYLEDIQNIDESIIKALKLDTSMVNINEAGTYTYTITFKKKKYNGTIIVKEKELPKVDILLKNIRHEKNTPISTELSTYISNTLTEEVKNHIILDLSKVVNTQAGIYQYTVTYNGNVYTGKIEIYEPKTTIITPNTNNNTNTNTNIDNDKENNNKKPEENKSEETTPTDTTTPSQ